MRPRCMRVAVVLLVGVVGCSSAEHKAPQHKDAGVAVAPRRSDAAILATDASTRKLLLTGAGRCGECHEKMFDEWEHSAHAKGMTSALYIATVAASKDTSCVRCHGPLAAVVPQDLLVSEGVTCDVCHALRDPRPSVDGGSWRLALDEMVVYGPRCDLEDHYFHRMGCSPEHRAAEICGACHWWEPKGIPVFTEYADWKAGPKHETPCQACHMPGSKAPMAKGSPVRTGVPHHGLLGRAKELRKSALAVDATLAASGALTITLHNKSSGHTVPSGLPERRIVVRARIVDTGGKETWHEQRELGRVLVDDANQEVPFWMATRVGSDTRIVAGGQATLTFAVPMPVAGRVELAIVYRGLSDAVARQLAVTEVEEQELVNAVIKLGGSYPKTAKR